MSHLVALQAVRKIEPSWLLVALAALLGLVVGAAAVVIIESMHLRQRGNLAEWAQVAAVALALVLAWRQLAAAKDDRRARERPFVVVDLEPGPVPKFLDLTVRNLGPTMARDVRFTFEPALAAANERPPWTLAEVGMLKDGIPALAPGRVLRTLFDHLPDRNKANLPERYLVTVSYNSDHRGPDAEPEFTEPMVLDVGVYMSAMYVSRKTTHDIAEQLEALQKELHRWTSFGLHVRSDSDLQAEAEEAQRELGEIRAELAEQAATKDHDADGGPFVT